MTSVETHQHLEQQVIVPPPDIKTIIDKLAKKVATQPEAQANQFTSLILKNDPNNPKFNFLKNDEDPYRPYYHRRLAEERGEIEAINQISEIIQPNKVVEMPTKPDNEFQQLLREEIFGRQQQAEIKPPPPDQFQAVFPQKMSSLELETLKLTAQFVARNQNKHFLQKLTQQEARNSRFDFLKPTHPSFSYFTAMVEQYSRVMLPRSEMFQRYRSFAENSLNVLKAGGQRQMYEEWRVQIAKSNKECDKDMEDASSVASSLDWDHFVVVEQIDLYDDVVMTPNGDFEDAIDDQRNAIEKQNHIQMAIQENQELETMPDPHAKVPQSAMALDPNLKLKTNYVKKPVVQNEEFKSQVQLCPNCKQDISKNEWRDHFKICVLDSKWKDQKQSRLDRQGGMNQLASGEEITENIKRFALQRPDLAGNYTEIVQQPVSTSNQMIWDGQSQNITRTTANIAMLRAQQQKNLQEALNQRGELDQKDLYYLRQQEEKPLQNTLLQKDFMVQPALSFQQTSEEDKALTQLQGNLRSEADWLRLYGKLTLTLQPDAAALSRLPASCQKFVIIEADCRMKVSELKEKLSIKLQAGITPNLFVIRGTSKNLALKETYTLAFFNIPDQVTLTYSISR